MLVGLNVYECLIFSNVDATFSFLERCGGECKVKVRINCNMCKLYK
jgi:hypothetical protein